jgi:hypothetical protein
LPGLEVADFEEYALDARAGRQLGDRDDRVVAAVDLKGLAATTEDLDRARGIGLQPDRRLAAADVTQHRADQQARHGCQILR